jgi:Fe-S-cluster-containing hydrogenase component 2
MKLVKIEELRCAECPECGQLVEDLHWQHGILPKFEEMLADGADPLRIQMKCLHCDHVAAAREFVRAAEGMMVVKNERAESGV